MKQQERAYLDGIEYQRLVAEQLRRKGYAVTNSAQGGQHGADLVVNGLPVEVKGSRYHALRFRTFGYSWLLHRNGKPRGVDGKVLILLAVLEGGVELFIMPSSFLADQHYIELSFNGGFYSQSKLTQWLWRLDVLDSAIKDNNETGVYNETLD